MIERYTRLNENVLHYQVTIDDPGAYSKPWTVGWKIAWMPGMEPLEYVCQENNKDVGSQGLGIWWAMPPRREAPLN